MRNMNLAFFSKNGMEVHYRDRKIVDQNSSCKVCESKMVAVREIIK